MSYTFTITCHTIEEADFLMAALRSMPAAAAENTNLSTGTEAKPATDPAKRRGRPSKTEPAAPVSTETAEPQGQPATEQDVTAAPEQQTPSTPEKAPTLDDARAALRGLQARIGEDDMATPIALLKEFGASRISEVKAVDYAAFIAACGKAA